MSRVGDVVRALLRGLRRLAVGRRLSRALERHRRAACELDIAVKEVLHK